MEKNRSKNDNEIHLEFSLGNVWVFGHLGVWASDNGHQKYVQNPHYFAYQLTIMM